MMHMYNLPETGTVLNDNFSESAADAQTTSAPHIRVHYDAFAKTHALHSHPHMEILFPTESNSLVGIRQKDYLLQPYDYLFITPGTEHIAKTLSSSYCSVLVDLSVFSSFTSMESLLGMLSPAVLITSETSPDTYQKIHSLIQSICELYKIHETIAGSLFAENALANSGIAIDLSELSIYAKFIEILVLITQSYNNITPKIEVTQKKSSDNPDRFSMILSYIDTHFTENLSLESISDMVNFSKFHFSRLFKDYTGESFYRYVNKKRIDYACELLIHRKMTITDIALASGYSSAPVFIRMFKQFNDCTPKEYRTRNKITLS